MSSLAKKKNGWSVVGTLGVALALLTTRSAWAAPLEVYGGLPTLEDVSLSPDGTRLALIRTSGNNRVLAVLSLTDHKLLGKPELVGTIKMRSVQWADDDHLLLISSNTDAPIFLEGRRQSEWRMLSVWDVVRQKLSSYPALDQFD